ncbi:MAG: hypothetical protein MZV65_21445 [Chromatiales bacterium]|nr:hypothetical protein [Chromatiales bacterium]
MKRETVRLRINRMNILARIARPSRPTSWSFPEVAIGNRPPRVVVLVRHPRAELQGRAHAARRCAGFAAPLTHRANAARAAWPARGRCRFDFGAPAWPRIRANCGAAFPGADPRPSAHASSHPVCADHRRRSTSASAARCMWLVLAATLISAANALARYALGRSLQRLARNPVVPVRRQSSCSARATPCKHNGHVRIDVIYGALSPRARAGLDRPRSASLLFLLPLCVLMVWLSLAAASSTPGRAARCRPTPAA